MKDWGELEARHARGCAFRGVYTGAEPGPCNCELGWLRQRAEITPPPRPRWQQVTLLDAITWTEDALTSTTLNEMSRLLLLARALHVVLEHLQERGNDHK